MKKYFLFVLFLLACVLAINFSPLLKKQARSVLYRFMGGSSSIFSDAGKSLKQKISFIFQIHELKDQNQELTEKIITLQFDKSRITELEKENALLKKELGFLDQNEKGTLIPAKIIDREPTSFLDFVIIDRGSDDNVAEGSAVVYNGVLVGQIKEVYKNQAKVVLVTSKDSLVQVMLQECRAKGILKGGINGLYMENIISDTDYKEGEYIITSGLGGKMKAGILIGKAGKIQSNSSGIFKNIAVEPIVDLSTLEIVFIEKK
jgi:rod shape-determining protein MreC